MLRDCLINGNRWVLHDHKWLNSFTLTFPEELGGLCQSLVVIPEGWEGHQFPAEMENPGRWGGGGPK